jgi:hypothetical protein
MIRDIARWIKHRFVFSIKGIIGYIFCDNNTKRLKQLKGTAKRKRCFIVATGPSLTIEDLEKLKGEVTFGVNSIFLVYDKTDWRPTEYVCTDEEYFNNIYKNYKLNPIELCYNNVFLNIKNKGLIGKIEKVKYIRFSLWNRSTDFRMTAFQPNISRGMYAFGTVTNIAIGIAMYMGYKEIYLIGADCSNLKQHIENIVSNNPISEDRADEIAQIQLKGYKGMKIVAEKQGVKILNATRGGALEVFERVNLDSVLEKRK